MLLRFIASRAWTFAASWIAAQIIFGVLFGLLTDEYPSLDRWKGSPLDFFVLSIIGLLLGLFLVFVFLLPKSIRQLIELIRLRISGKDIQFIWAFGGGIVAVIVLLLLRLSPATPNAIVRAIEHGRQDGKTFYVSLALLVGPFLEEPIMRGFLYQAFRGSYILETFLQNSLLRAFSAMDLNGMQGEASQSYA